VGGEGGTQEREKGRDVISLFGDEIPEVDPSRTLIRKRLGPYNYRPRFDVARCCGTCSHHFMRKANKTYHKCELLGDSAAPSTDIRVRWVCDAWHQDREKM